MFSTVENATKQTNCIFWILIQFSLRLDTNGISNMWLLSLSVVVALTLGIYYYYYGLLCERHRSGGNENYSPIVHNSIWSYLNVPSFFNMTSIWIYSPPMTCNVYIYRWLINALELMSCMSHQTWRVCTFVEITKQMPDAAALNFSSAFIAYNNNQLINAFIFCFFFIIEKIQ